MNWYEFYQNNSGGKFIINDNLCRLLYIEAENYPEAKKKAEDLGCYWDGVQKGIDCPCCGDRWNDYEHLVDWSSYSEKGYKVRAWEDSQKECLDAWHKKYSRYGIAENPHIIKSLFGVAYEGYIKFRSMEEYVQFVANEWGMTKPDARLFYHDGTVKEVYKEEKK